MYWKMARLIALLFLFFPICCFSQQSKEDSLIHRLRQVDGKEKIKTYYALGNGSFYIDYSKTKKYFLKGLELSKKGRFRSLEVEGEWSLAGLEDFYGDKFKSLDRLMKLCRSRGFSKKDSCIVYGLLGNSLESLGAMEMAIEYTKVSIAHEFNPDRIEHYYVVEHLADCIRKHTSLIRRMSIIKRRCI